MSEQNKKTEQLENAMEMMKSNPVERPVIYFARFVIVFFLASPFLISSMLLLQGVGFMFVIPLLIGGCFFGLPLLDFLNKINFISGVDEEAARVVVGGIIKHNKAVKEYIDKLNAINRKPMNIEIDAMFKLRDIK